MRARQVVQEARTLTSNRRPKEAALALISAQWTFIGAGAYKAGFRKGVVVVKVASVIVHRAEACRLEDKRAYYTENSPCCGSEVGDILGIDDNWHPGRKPPSEIMDWANTYRSLPASARRYMAHPFFAEGYIICQLAVEGYKGCDKVNCRNASSLIHEKTGKWFGDLGTDHNHGHLKDGTPVAFDGL